MASERDIRELVDVLPVPTVALLPGGDTAVMNDACTTLFGLDLPGALDRSWVDVIHPDDLMTAWHAIEDSRPGDTVGPIDLRIVHGDGSWVECAAAFRLDEQLGWFVITVMDIRERRRIRQSLVEAARTDALTGIANRAGLTHDLERSCADDHGQLVAVIDLDRFKRINDTLGHAVGDEVLTVVAKRLQTLVGDAGTVGRMGGDEFVVLIRGSHADPEELGHRIAATVAQRIAVGGRHVSVECSIGVSVGRGDAVAADLLHHADYASYAAKRRDGSAWVVADDELIATRRRSAQLDFELRTAAWNGEFVPWFQPIVDLERDATIGHESLVRWARRDGKVVAASDFIDRATDIGLVASIGREVMYASIEAAGSVELGLVGINVSAGELADELWLDEACRHADAWGVSRERIMLEFSESLLTSDLGLAATALRRYANAGFRIAVDTFGSVHAPLVHLADLPIDVVKFDRSLLRRSAPGAASGRMFESLVRFVQSLELELIVEGVESADDDRRLRELGVRFAQGWFHGRPMPAGAIA